MGTSNQNILGYLFSMSGDIRYPIKIPDLIHRSGLPLVRCSFTKFDKGYCKV